MADIEAVELLTQAKEKIMEHGWGRGVASARDMGISPCPDMQPGTYCLEDALCGRDIMLQWVIRDHMDWYSHMPKAVLTRAAAYLREAIGSGEEALLPSDELWYWNDRQKSAGPVLAAIDDAILLAKEAPNPTV